MILMVVIREAICPSCPHAWCKLFFEAKGNPDFSIKLRASNSDLIRTVLIGFDTVILAMMAVGIAYKIGSIMSPSTWARISRMYVEVLYYYSPI